MTYQVKLTTYAKGEIESVYLWHKRYDGGYADSWFRGLMNTIATLQEKPLRCALAREDNHFSRRFSTMIWANSGVAPKGSIIAKLTLLY